MSKLIAVVPFAGIAAVFWWVIMDKQKATNENSQIAEIIPRDRLALARTLYGEARGEGVEGMQAVAKVIMNRVHSSRWFGGRNVQDVVYKPYQFSCWNLGDQNRAIIENLLPGQGNKLFDKAYQIAGLALAGDLPDLVGQSTHYHTAAVSPNWSEGREPDYQVGNHLFYEGVS